MISPKRAIEILKEEGCSSDVIEHVKAVRDVSMEIAKKISANNFKVNLNLVEIGALLHDIGRSKTHEINHGIVGANILEKKGLEELAPIARNHLGAGISKEEAKKLGLPEKEFIPNSIEEKIITYGDNLIDGNEKQSYREAVKELEEELGPNHDGVSRFKNLHDELEKLGAFN